MLAGQDFPNKFLKVGIVSQFKLNLYLFLQQCLIFICPLLLIELRSDRSLLRKSVLTVSKQKEESINFRMISKSKQLRWLISRMKSCLKTTYLTFWEIIQTHGNTFCQMERRRNQLEIQLIWITKTNHKVITTPQTQVNIPRTLTLSVDIQHSNLKKGVLKSDKKKFIQTEVCKLQQKCFMFFLK